MSEREEHKELIHRLAERLRNHTEPYKDGAWERFAATHGKRRPTLWPYASAAAVLLAAVGWYWSARYADETRVTPPIAQQEVVAQPVDPATPPGQPAGHTPQPRATALVVVPEETVAVPKEVLMVQEATLVKETDADPGEVADSKVPPPTVVVAATDT